jgi:beta-glucosidase
MHQGVLYMSTLSFPSDFLWGAATASFQVEGAGREGGRSDSIWDTFCRTPGKVHAGDNGDVSCDQYNRFPEDIAIMKAAGIQSYRFSIAWPRILPQGTGKPNQAGLAYYRRLIKALKDAGIKPVATLYHWDLPQILQDAGGWSNRATAEAFAAYARICYEALGDELDTWITINEPLCVAYLGHLIGIHAPGIQDPATAYRVVHHINLAHGLAVKAFRNSGKKGRIGIVWNLTTPRPATLSADDKAAVERVVDHDSRMFTSPVLGKGYPALAGTLGIDLPILAGDMELIAQPIDFIGLNYYTERPVKADDSSPLGASEESSWQPVTDMGWPVVPQGLLRQLRWIAAEAPGIPLYIMENGSAEADIPVMEADGSRRVHDTRRIAYLRSHLAVCSAAIAEGIPLKGYFVWSFIDNFEWALGYSKRFGIVYCDFQSLERIPKDSCYWYRDLIAGYGE